MGWAVGFDRERQRHIGYGVPATCDYPGCGEEIDRGLAYACGGGVVGLVENCGLFFCSPHRCHFIEEEGGPGGEWVCERCAADEPPFEPTPDRLEWIEHVLEDESWGPWRAEQPDWVERLRQQRAAAS